MARHERSKDRYQKLLLVVSPAEQRALEWTRRRYFKPNANIANVARYITALALQRPEMVGSWLRQLARYSEAEDVHQLYFLEDTLARRNEFKRLKLTG